MPSPNALPLDDYEVIALAVAETERGRWFLDEYARRNRTADTVAVLDALSSIEAEFAAGGRAEVARARALVDAAAATLARLRRDLEALEGGGQARARCRSLEETLASALVALGGAPRSAVGGPDAPSISAALGGAFDPEPDFGWSEPVEDDLAEPALDAAIETLTEKPAPEAEEPGGGPENGGEAQEFLRISALDPEIGRDGLEPSGTPAARPAGARAGSRISSGWTPGMLDRLTPEERSILFA